MPVILPTAPPRWTPTWSDWTPPLEWTCPRCQTVHVTREASPRCERCGFREGT